MGAGLGGMGYSCRSYKKTIPNYKFIKEVDSKPEFLRIKNFTRCNISKYPYGS